MHKLSSTLILLIVSSCIAGQTLAQNKHWAPTEYVPRTFAFTDQQLVSRRGDPIRKIASPDKESIPPSQWLSRKAAQALHQATKTKRDLLVLPAQVHAFGLNRATLNYFTEQISFHLDAAALSSLIAQDYVNASIALPRHLNEKEVKQAAEDYQVVNVVEPYIGFYASEENLMLAVTLRKWHKEADTWKTHISPQFEQQFSHSEPPIDAFHKLLPKILNWLDATHDPNKKIDTVGLSKRSSTKLPVFADNPTDPVAYAVHLQRLGAIVPRHRAELRRQLYSKSLSALQAAQFKDPLLKARALMEMGYPPAASAILENSENQCQSHYLIADLEKLTQCALASKDPIHRLFYLLDAAHLLIEFEVQDNNVMHELLDAASDLHPSWLAYIENYMLTMDDWGKVDPEWLSEELSQHFPVPDSQNHKGRSFLDYITTSDIMLDNIEQVRRYKDNHLKSNTTSPIPNADFLETLGAYAVEAPFKSAHIRIYTQALYDRALEIVESMNAELAGHPDFAALEAQALTKKIEGSRENQADAMRRDGFEAAARAYYWSSENSWASARASVSSTSLRYPTLSRVGSMGSDWPGSLTVLEDVAYKFTNFYRYEFRLERALNTGSSIEKTLLGLFNGHPKKAGVLLNARFERGKYAEAKELAQELINVESTDSTPYKILHKILMSEGDYGAAAEAYKRFPPFQEISEDNRIVNSNLAADAGSALLWAGRSDLATEFFHIAEEYRSGSARQITASMRLAQLDSDVEAMFSANRYLAQRYPSASTLKDFLGLLVALGEPDAVEQIFNDVYKNQHGYGHWDALLAAQRKRQLSSEGFQEWYNQINHTSAAIRESKAIMLMRSQSMDRIPSEWASNQISAITAKKAVGSDGVVGTAVLIPGLRDLIDLNNAQVGDTYMWPNGQPGRIVESPNAYFLRADKLAKLGDMQRANKILSEMESLFPIMAIPHVMPLYTYVKHQVNDTEGLSELLERYSTNHLTPAHELARALDDGLNGDTAQAINHFRRATGLDMKRKKAVLSPTYLTGQTWLWLWQSTGADEYREAGLAWSHTAQITEHYHAWPYALEAIFQTDAEKQLEAARKAAVLDPNSTFLEMLPKHVSSAARRIGAEETWIWKTGDPANRQAS